MPEYSEVPLKAIKIDYQWNTTVLTFVLASSKSLSKSTLLLVEQSFFRLKKVCYSSDSNLRPFEDHCLIIFGNNRLIELQKYELSTLTMGLGSMWVILYESRDGMIATVLKIPWYFPYWILSHFVSSWTHRGGLLNGSKILFRNIWKFLDFSRF